MSKVILLACLYIICFCRGLTQQPATRSTQQLTHCSLLPQWDGEENVREKAELARWDKDSFIRKQMNE